MLLKRLLRISSHNPLPGRTIFMHIITCFDDIATNPLLIYKRSTVFYKFEFKSNSADKYLLQSINLISVILKISSPRSVLNSKHSRFGNKIKIDRKIRKGYTGLSLYFPY